MNEYKYDLSIIIPIYNAEKLLAETLDSVLAQKGKFTYEVLMIDDGSQDKSAEICQKYAAEHKNFKYIHQDNSGVSKTRNKGMDLAAGKYIMFLDADDLLKRHTLSNIVKNFNKYYDQADILTYPIFVKEFDEIRDHIRSVNYAKSGVMDIKKHPYFNQTTINTVVKNLPKGEKIYFNEKLTFAEDAMFNTAMIVRKDKIIISREGGYLYRRESSSLSTDSANPVQSAQMLLEYCETMMKLAHSDASRAYIESILFYEISWRFTSRGLYPLHLKGVAKKKWYDRFDKIMDFISPKTIGASPYLNRYHINYFLYEYKKKQISVSNDEKGIYYKADGKVVYSYNRFKLLFNKIKIVDDHLHLEGILYNRGYLFTKDKLALIVKVNEQEINVPLTDDIPADYYRTTFKSAVFYRFQLNLKLDRTATYQFWVKYNDQFYETNHEFSDFVIFKRYLKMNIATQDGHVVTYQRTSLGDTFEISTTNNPQGIKNYEKRLTAKIRKRKGYRRLLTILNFLDPFYNKRKIWLYNDRIGVFDNGYAQFMNDMNKNDNIERFYVYSEEDSDHPKIKAIPKNKRVLRNTNKHRILFVYSSMVLTSYSALLDYSPFNEATFNFVYVRLKYKLAYLQHGILHGHLPKYYSKDKTEIDYFVVSSDFERDNLINFYGYKKANILTTGMPRLKDASEKREVKKSNKILYAPSWRSSITDSIGIEDRIWQINNEAFAKTTYYKNIAAFLYDEKLHKILEKHNYTLDVKMHPNFISVLSLFPSRGPIDVIKPDDIINIEEYKLLITDFSSFLFDFAQAHTAMMFYYPDYNEFICGNHTYNKLDLDLSKYVHTYKDPQALIKAIDHDIKGGFKLSKTAINYFDKLLYKADNNAEKIYQILIKK